MVSTSKTIQNATPPSSAGQSHDGKLLLIDGHSMAFRAFYALPADNFATSTGQATNAVHGFVSMFLSLLDSERPSHVAVAFDLPGGTFRTEEYPEYKGTRDETPPAFIGQIELIEAVLDAMKVRYVTAPGFEADDILATLSTLGRQQGLEVLVCSGDRDSFQLVNEDCTVLYPIKGVSQLRRMTPDEVQERYGIPPQRYPHLAALVGETSDNLPGVPGVGPKTAAKWINLYDGLEGVLAHADDIKGKAGESLRAHIEDVKRNRRLNRLLTDLDLGIDPQADLRFVGSDRQAVDQVFANLEFRSLKERAKKILPFQEPDAIQAQDSSACPVASFDTASIHILGVDLSVGELNESIQQLLAKAEPEFDGLLGLDVVGTPAPGQADATVVSISNGTEALVVDLADLSPADETALAELLADTKQGKVVADAKGAWHCLNARGLTLDGVVSDPSLMAYLCHPDRRSYDVNTLALRWLDLDLEAKSATETGQSSFDLDALMDTNQPRESDLAAGLRANATLALHRVLAAEVERVGAQHLLLELEMPVAACLTTMEQAGIAVDSAVLEQRLVELDARVTGAQQRAYDAVGHELNLSSPKQLQAVLFDELKMPKTRKTKTGYTTNADALQSLWEKTSHPFLENLLEHRDAIKLRQTVEGLRKATLADGRIHTTFQQTVTATGRLSSTDPNLQNIPARTEEGRRIREAFVVGDDYECLLTADYSQIEMRIMAHLSGDAGLINAFRSGEDLHRYVAALVHGIDVVQVTQQQRSQVKAMSYGLAYGLSAYGLSKQLGISVGEATDLMDSYFARFGRVRDYLESVVEQARRDGYTETMFGRRRYLPDLSSDNRQRREIAERAALNAPIQGTAADIVKRAMIDVEERLAEEQLQSRLLLQIHDELIVEVAPGEADQVEEILRTEMGAAVELQVPLDVSVGRGRNWREAAH